MIDMGTKLLTIKEVMELAGVSRYTLYRDSKNGKIEAINFGRSVRYRETDAKEYAEEKKDSPLINYYKNKKEQEGV